MTSAPAPRPGRKRDDTRDPQILDAALAVLAEVGYATTSMEAIAARAGAAKATVYRRWPSKAHLVHDAILRMSAADVDLAAVPDTGSLLGDIRAAQRPHTLGEQRLRVIVALASMANGDDAGLGAAAFRASVEPWVGLNRLLLERAVARGEVAGDIDIPLLSRLVPSMCMYRVAVEHRALDAAFTTGLVERVLLPAVGLRPG